MEGWALLEVVRAEVIIVLPINPAIAVFACVSADISLAHRVHFDRAEASVVEVVAVHLSTHNFRWSPHLFVSSDCWS